MSPALLDSEARRAPALAALRARVQQARPSVVTCDAPFSNCRSVGSRARGLTYERKVGRLLAAYCNKMGWKLWDHQWFVYKCGNEVSYFQPDFIIEREHDAVLIETKLTFVDTNTQINKYLKYLKVFGLDCFPLVIVRNLTPNAPFPITDISEMAPGRVLHLWV